MTMYYWLIYHEPHRRKKRGPVYLLVTEDGEILHQDYHKYLVEEVASKQKIDLEQITEDVPESVLKIVKSRYTHPDFIRRIEHKTAD